jgi:hypothetical protein
MILSPDPARVTGATLRRVAGPKLLPAGTYRATVVLGSPTEESTATLLIREVGGSTLLTFASALYPARLAAQDFTLAAETEIECVVQNSIQNRGQAAVGDIRISLAPLQQWANGIRLTLAADITSGATSFSVVGGSALPSLSGGQFFMATLQEGTAWELIRVTARSGNLLTVSRGEEGSDPQAFTSAHTVLLVANTADTMATFQGLL